MLEFPNFAWMDFGKYMLSEADRELLESIPVFRRDVKRLVLRVRNGVPQIIAPLFTPENVIASFLVKNLEWLGRSLTSAAEAEAKRMNFSREMLPLFRARLQAVADECESRMGIRASGYQIKVMKSRWGSCSPLSRRISINFALAPFDDSALRYVVIHELAHILHPDHSPRFWATVEKYCPDYRVLRALLRTTPMPRFMQK